MYEQHTATTAFVCPAYLLVILVGSLGNGLLIYYYITDKTIHRSFNFLVTNLAAADFIMCALFTPLLFVYRVNAPANLIAISPLCELCVFLSVLSISMMYFIFPLMALHRKDVMLRPHNPYLSLKQAQKLMSLFWFLCALFSSFMVYMAWREYTSDDQTPKLYRCILVNTHIDTYSMTFLVYSASLYGASIVITVATYIIIFKALSSQEVGVNGTAEERHNTKLCLWVAVVYTVCWTPFLLIQLAGIFGTYSEVDFNLHACSSAIGVLASAINPGLYVAMDQYYRNKFRSFITPFLEMFAKET